MKENLLAVKNEKLTSNPKETMSSIAKKWHLLGSESKSSYKHRASVVKEEYLHKIKEFEAGPLKDFLVNRKSQLNIAHNQSLAAGITYPFFFFHRRISSASLSSSSSLLPTLLLLSLLLLSLPLLLSLLLSYLFSETGRLLRLIKKSLSGPASIVSFFQSTLVLPSSRAAHTTTSIHYQATATSLRS